VATQLRRHLQSRPVGHQRERERDLGNLHRARADLQGAGCSVSISYESVLREMAATCQGGRLTCCA
jgi:hypothetical protein